MKKASVCPVCSSEKIEKYLRAPNQHGNIILKKNKKFTYYHCLSCGVVFLHGISIDKKYYQTYYSFSENKKNNTLFKAFEDSFGIYSNYKKRKLIEQFANNKKKSELLDIGCGTGNFLASLDTEKYHGVGIERDKKEFQITKEKNITVYCSDILHQNFNGKKFDVITLWHVVEHIPDPHKLFQKIKLLLKKDGILIITIPNRDSLGFKIAKERWFHLDAPRHLILYGQKGIKELSRHHGFSIKKTLTQTFEFPLDLFWSIKHSQQRYYIYPVYPFMKYLSKETVTFVLKKSHDK